MNIIYYVKLEKNEGAIMWNANNFEDFLYDLKDFMLKNDMGEIEWIIRGKNIKGKK